MKTFDLYGVDAPDLEAARNVVEGVLGIYFVAHESGYRGGAYYRLGDVGVEHFILQANHDAFGGEWAEPEFKEKAFLLYVNETSRSAKILAALLTDPAFMLIRHQEL